MRRFAAMHLLAVLATWAMAPAASAEVEHGIPYARRSAGALKLDVYRPAGRSARPIVVLVHGGGWWSGGRLDMETVALDLAERGFVVASIDYRLACGTSRAPRRAFGVGFNFRGNPLCGAYIPQQVADVQEAVAFVRRTGRRYGGDPARIALAGSSAGGHLALLAAVTAPFRSQVRAVVTWSGPSSTRFIEAQPARVPGSIRPAFTNAVGCTLAQCPEEWAAAAPLQLVTPQTAPFAVFASGSQYERQVPAFSLVSFDRRVRSLGWTSVIALARGSCHSRECFDQRVVSRGGGTVWTRTLSFLEGSVVTR